jgi:hypothetical protein
MLIVIVYKLYSVREGFYHSINPCFSNDTPYIKFDNKYVCFDISSNTGGNKVENKVENTLQVFYGKDKNCFIDPKNTAMNFYNMDGTLVDTIKEKSNKMCKPYSVNIVQNYQSSTESSTKSSTF